MRQNVMNGNHGKSAEFYSLHICVQTTSGYILQTACNCKADATRLCAHIGALLYTLVKTKTNHALVMQMGLPQASGKEAKSKASL